jgi:hypothetical protein
MTLVGRSGATSVRTALLEKQVAESRQRVRMSFACSSSGTRRMTSTRLRNKFGKAAHVGTPRGSALRSGMGFTFGRTVGGE